MESFLVRVFPVRTDSAGAGLHGVVIDLRDQTSFTFATGAELLRVLAVAGERPAPENKLENPVSESAPES